MATPTRWGVTHDGSLWYTPAGNTYLTRFEAEREAYFEYNPNATACRKAALAPSRRVLPLPPPIPLVARLDPFAPRLPGEWQALLVPEDPPYVFSDVNVVRTVRDTGDPSLRLGPVQQDDRALRRLARSLHQTAREAIAYQGIQIDTEPTARENADVTTHTNEPTPVEFRSLKQDQSYLDAYKAATALAEETAIPPERMKKKYFAVRFAQGTFKIVSGDFSEREIHPDQTRTVWIDGDNVPVAELCHSADAARARAWVQLMGPAAPMPPFSRTGDRPDGTPCLTAEEHAGYVRAWKHEVQAQLRAELRTVVLEEMQRELGLAEASRVRVETLQQEYHGALAVKKQLEENEQTHARHHLYRLTREREAPMPESTLPSAPLPTSGSGVAAAAAPMLSALTHAVKTSAGDAVDSVKADGKKALLRTTCRQGVRIAREGILSIMKKHKAPKAAAGLAERVLSTRAGEGFLGWGLGVVIKQVPMLSQYPAAQLVAEELRVEGMSIGSDTLAEVARVYLVPSLGPLFEMFTQASSQLDREPAELPSTALPVSAPPQESRATSSAA